MTDFRSHWLEALSAQAQARGLSKARKGTPEYDEYKRKFEAANLAILKILRGYLDEVTLKLETRKGGRRWDLLHLEADGAILTIPMARLFELDEGLYDQVRKIMNKSKSPFEIAMDVVREAGYQLPADAVWKSHKWFALPDGTWCVIYITLEYQDPANAWVEVEGDCGWGTSYYSVEIVVFQEKNAWGDEIKREKLSFEIPADDPDEIFGSAMLDQLMKGEQTVEQLIERTPASALAWITAKLGLNEAAEAYKTAFAAAEAEYDAAMQDASQRFFPVIRAMPSDAPGKDELRKQYRLSCSWAHEQRSERTGEYRTALVQAIREPLQGLETKVGGAE